MGRVFSFVATILALAAGMYIYSRQAKATFADNRRQS